MTAIQAGAILPPLSGRYFARLAARAYDDAISPDMHAGSTEIYLTEYAGRHVLTWRGSTDRADWFADLTAWPAYDPELGCRVHGGFLSCARAAAPDLRRWLDRNREPVILCGHSKGAAEATIAAAMMCAWGMPPAALVTFGSPRCGFSGLRKALTGVRIDRYVNAGDPVTGVPFVFGWQPVSPAIRIGRRGWPARSHLIESYIQALDEEDAHAWARWLPGA